MIGYIFTSAMIKGAGIIFSYKNERLSSLEIQAELTDVQHIWLLSNIPATIDDLDGLVLKAQKGKITEIEPDLSFDHFYKEYGNKNGNKKRAERLWKALSKANKIKALSWISTYKNIVKMDGINMMYADTYLHQQRWNN